MVSSTASAWISVSPNRVDQLGRGVGLAVAVADDPDRLVEVVEDDREAFEDVDPLEQVLQLVAEPAGDDFQPEVEEMLEDALEIEPAGDGDLGPGGGQQAGQVDVVSWSAAACS